MKCGDRVSHKSGQRLLALDALRGFDMFWIIGAGALADGLKALHVPGADYIAMQLTHASWNGFHFYDLIFPLFIFMVGISTVFSLEKRLAMGDDVRRILRHIFKRTLLLFVLGMFYNGGVSESPIWSHLRVMGVLQRIALCYFFASMIILTARRRTQAYITGGLLIGYWVLMRFVPVPGYGAGYWQPVGNFAQFIDSHIIPAKLYFNSWDPEGLISTIPAVATCLIGVLTGHWLRGDYQHKNHPISPERKNLILIMAGVGLCCAGILWDYIFPINKSLWTSSFVLLTGGLCMILLAMFHWIIDIKGYKKWAFPFVVIGMNSLFIYLAANIVPFDDISRRIVGGDISSWLGSGRILCLASAQMIIQWLMLYWMYKKKIWIKL